MGAIRTGACGDFLHKRAGMTDAATLARAAALVAAFKAQPDRSFAPDEIACLTAVSDSDLWAAKVVGLHHYKAGALDRALPMMRSIAEREPTSENIKNIAVMLRGLERPQEAIAWLEAHRARVEPILYNDLLCSLYRQAGDVAGAIRAGDETLRLKDALSAPQPLDTPVVRSFDVNARSRNVIAFSLWGADPRYLNGAMNNAIVARYLYPGWTARFYVDESVPDAVKAGLLQQGADVRTIPDMPRGSHGLFWRFMVEDDSDVDVYLCRDADSVMNVKERWAVSDWLTSGKAFHVMRDDPSHSELMLAGMWGAHRGNLSGMRARVDAYLGALGVVANHATKDQEFLRTEIWPIVRNSVHIHDSYFSFLSPARYDPDFALPRSMHIGQNDWVHFRKN